MTGGLSLIASATLVLSACAPASDHPPPSGDCDASACLEHRPADASVDAADASEAGEDADAPDANDGGSDG